MQNHNVKIKNSAYQPIRPEYEENIIFMIESQMFCMFNMAKWGVIEDEFHYYLKKQSQWLVFGRKSPKRQNEWMLNDSRSKHGSIKHISGNGWGSCASVATIGLLPYTYRRGRAGRTM
jgi:hypothetical protein